jgi:hypothetical protein
MADRPKPHAAARIAEWAIPADWLDATLQEPVQLVELGEGRREYRCVFVRSGKRRLLLVVCERDLVITAWLTSKLAKYGVSET